MAATIIILKDTADPIEGISKLESILLVSVFQMYPRDKLLQNHEESDRTTDLFRDMSETQKKYLIEEATQEFFSQKHRDGLTNISKDSMQ